MFYRIGIINDYKNEHSFIEYKRYGTLEIWNASKSKGPMSSHNTPEDGIHVFLNFTKLDVFKSKEEAQILINKLITESPVDITEYLEVLSL